MFRPTEAIEKKEGFLNNLERKRLSMRMKAFSKKAHRAQKQMNFGKAEDYAVRSLEFRDRALQRANENEEARNRILREDLKGSKLRAQSKVWGLERM